jgi:hypothetical protein
VNVLAWVVCLIGMGAGIVGCVALATVPRAVAAPGAVNAAEKRPKYSIADWAELVAVEAERALGVVRRLAAGITVTDVTAVQVALHDVAASLTALEQSMPARTPEAARFGREIEVVVLGARAEAARLSGVATAGHDRRAFLTALRALRDAPSRLVPPAQRRTAVGEMRPSLQTA